MGGEKLAAQTIKKETIKQKSITGSKKHTNTYDEDKIKTLGSFEHIRLRSGMYIGRLGDGSHPDDGIYVLFKEIIDNSVDEYIMGNGNSIDIRFIPSEKKIFVRDYGRGIPLGKILECVSVINTGAKYNNDVFQFSVGLNGVGTKVVNALSSCFLVMSYRDGKYKSISFSRGTLVEEKQGSTKERNGTYIEFIPDEEIFKDYVFDEEIIKTRLRNYSYLNRNLTLVFNKEKFKSANGLADLLQEEVGDKQVYPILHSREVQRNKKVQLEFALTHMHSDNNMLFSFVNGQYTSDGGTHQSAFLEGLLRGVNEFYSKSYSSADLREGIVGAVSIRLENPIFESQTKNKLGNTDIRAEIMQKTREAIVDMLYKDKKLNTALFSKLEQNQKLRKELSIVKKEAREAERRVSIKIPHFRDCKFHRKDKEFSDSTTVFITEGHSASGSIVPARNVSTQAVFSLRGKITNVIDGKRAKIYKDSELYNMMVALGIENSIDNLRFNRVVIATDADFDGFHIRNLLITFFLTYFEKLVLDGHLYIFETPLFKVRNKKELLYCYNAHERDSALQKLGVSAEVTRFKGLGEISPHEFGQFLGDDIKLIPVLVKTRKNISKMLHFYMGSNTDERKKFMKENLI